MNITKNNIEEKFDHFTSYWTPHVIAELNGQAVKIAKIKGNFIWHKHNDEDEMFWVIKGSMKMELRNQTMILNEGDFTVIPKGVEHKPSAENETHILMFEPKETLNTGSEKSPLTVKNPQTI
ncbi:MAG: mannose-6-phosphate isomerase [Flammeovirgaceae bacterium]|nr:mannose-6-phosphate isomerase [Flammeovirgaceae bacterium]|tara:strand:+ start:412 stop:777 length:366 start_codon:yes stop_codon:yes gene_type:complete